MSDLIEDSAQRLFDSHAPGPDAGLTADLPARGWDGALWSAIAGAGYPLALLREDQGGFDLPAAAALGLIRLAGARALTLPLGETMLANWLWARAGLGLCDGPAGFGWGGHLQAVGAGGADGTDGAVWRVTAHLPRVAHGRDLAGLALLARGQDGASYLCHLPPGGWQVAPARNLASEPRDDLVIDMDLPAGQVARYDLDGETLAALGAMIRSLSIAGAADAALELSLRYANDRVQFGRPIGRFQAVQQQLAVMAGEVAATRAGADMVAQAFAGFDAAPAGFALAAASAKLRASEAAGKIASIAHQTHGAIGITRDYPLHPLTRRLWAWRDEHGNEAHWAGVIGAQVCALGPDGFWPMLTTPAGAA